MFLLLLIWAGDIELNPHPIKKIPPIIFFCHWNLNIIVAHNLPKLCLLEAQVRYEEHKFDMICLSETFLDSSIPSNDEMLNMKR